MEVKKKTIILLSIWIMLLIIVPFLTLKMQNILSSNNSSYISSNFNIENYSIILDVDKNNKVDVTENFTIDIPSEDYNGIYKSIPLWQEYYDNNKLKKKKIEISNIRSIGEKIVLDKFNNKVGIRIGSSKVKSEQGAHTYTLKYRYDEGKDDNDNYDLFTFNLFDNYDDTKINNMNVTINMPKPLNGNIAFLNGMDDITDKVNYQIDGNIINIHLNDYILQNSLTVKITLPDKYFVGETSNYGFICLFICLLIIIIAVYSFYIWMRHSQKTNKRAETVEFYAPDDLDAAQIGYIYGENSLKKLTTALIIELASKGYISIEKTIDNKYVIKKLDDTNLKPLSITEQTVYLELFKKGSENILSEDKSFINVFDKIKQILQTSLEKKINNQETKQMTRNIFSALIISIIIWMIAYLFIKDLNPKFDIFYLLSFTSIFITGFFSIFMNYRTNYYEVIIARIKGFKNYLETAEKNQLNLEVEKNPNYFYDILPYTYVLGVSDHWIKTFEKNNVQNIDLGAIDSYENSLFMIIE